MRASRPVQRVVTRFVAKATRVSSSRARPARCSRSASAALAMTRTPAAGAAALPWGTSAGNARSVIADEVWVIERGRVGISVMASAWKVGSGDEAWAASRGPLLVAVVLLGEVEGFSPLCDPVELSVGEDAPLVVLFVPVVAERLPPRSRLFLCACFSLASSRAARTAVRTALFASCARERCR